MAKSKSSLSVIGGINMKLKYVAGPASKVSKLIADEFKTKVTDKAVATFIEIQPYAKYKDVIEGGYLFTNASPLGANIAPLASYPKASDLKRLYVKAWKNTYDSYIQKHMQITPENKYAKAPWVRYKRNNIGSPSKIFPSKPLKYKGHSLATGHLRDTIADAFEAGGANHVSVFNLLVKGGYKWEKGQYETDGGLYHKWIDIISSNFQSKGMYSALKGDADNIVQLSGNDWNDIAKLMLQIYKDGPVEDIKNLLTTFTIEV
jgi:hypothetical protein